MYPSVLTEIGMAFVGGALGQVVDPTPIPPETPLGIFGSAGTGPRVYVDEPTSGGIHQYYFPGGSGREIADDLTTIALGSFLLTDFAFTYYKPSVGSTNATVSFYENGDGDPFPTQLLASFQVDQLPSGLNWATIAIPDGLQPLLSDELWMGVMFDAPDAGLALAPVPTVGASDDYFTIVGSSSYFTFGSIGPGNFDIVLNTIPSASSMAPLGLAGLAMSRRRRSKSE